MGEVRPGYLFFFFFNDTATTEIYTLSLHDALPICRQRRSSNRSPHSEGCRRCCHRSEEHTSELQSLRHLVCRLLLEKKKSLLRHSSANWLDLSGTQRRPSSSTH